MRINKYLATAGVASRRHADELIRQGVVKVNNLVVTQLGLDVDPTRDTVLVNNQPVAINETKTVVYLLNKPRGVITSVTDTHGRPTVADLVPASPRVFPCGRLDEDTDGLVILTNDGDLCYQLTHPKFEHQKEYIVEGRAKDPTQALEKIRNGVKLADGPIKPDALTVLKTSREKLEFSLTIHEGRNRLVRRMCAAAGIEVDRLTRTRMGQYKLGNLQSGQYTIVE